MDIPIFWAIFAIAIIFAGFFTAIHTNKMPITGFMLKGVATVAVIALALVGGFTGMLTRAEGIIIVIGLVFCMLGDIALALHEFGLSDPERKEPAESFASVLQRQGSHTVYIPHCNAQIGTVLYGRFPAEQEGPSLPLFRSFLPLHTQFYTQAWISCPYLQELPGQFRLGDLQFPSDLP